VAGRNHPTIFSTDSPSIAAAMTNHRKPTITHFMKVPTVRMALTSRMPSPRVSNSSADAPGHHVLTVAGGLPHQRLMAGDLHCTAPAGTVLSMACPFPPGGVVADFR
jgi:hypothetical protein